MQACTRAKTVRLPTQRRRGFVKLDISASTARERRAPPGNTKTRHSSISGNCAKGGSISRTIPPRHAKNASLEGMRRLKGLIRPVRHASLGSIRMDWDQQHVWSVAQAALQPLMARLMRRIAARARKGSFNRRVVLRSASFVLLGRVNGAKLRLLV